MWKKQLLLSYLCKELGPRNHPVAVGIADTFEIFPVVIYICVICTIGTCSVSSSQPISAVDECKACVNTWICVDMRMRECVNLEREGRTTATGFPKEGFNLVLSETPSYVLSLLSACPEPVLANRRGFKLTLFEKKMQTKGGGASVTSERVPLLSFG